MIVKFSIHQERNLGQEHPWFYLKSGLFRTAGEAEKVRRRLEELQKEFIQGEGEDGAISTKQTTDINA